MNVEIGAVAAQFLFWNICLYFRYWFFAVYTGLVQSTGLLFLLVLKSTKSTQMTVFRTLHINNTIESEMSITGILDSIGCIVYKSGLV
jgi:hypothetical protein